MIFSLCISCGGQFPKPLRKRIRNGKIRQSRSRKCIYCVREDSRIKYEKIRLIPERYKNLLRLARKWAINNKEKVKEYQQQYDIKNAAAIRRRKSEYYIKNKKKILARNKIWKDANRVPRGIRNNKHPWRTYENDRIARDIKRREECRMLR